MKIIKKILFFVKMIFPIIIKMTQSKRMILNSPKKRMKCFPKKNWFHFFRNWNNSNFVLFLKLATRQLAFSLKWLNSVGVCKESFWLNLSMLFFLSSSNYSKSAFQDFKFESFRSMTKEKLKIRKKLQFNFNGL